jgi:dTDP-L-rhamnose 4-epimerase
MKVLITGGAGFVGSHTADALLDKGYEVRVFDNLTPQVHGVSGKLPDYLNREVEFIHGDVRDREAVKKALHGIHAIYHLAAAVGVGQSMYEVYEYVSANSLGGAALLDVLIKEKLNVEKVVVASSMSIYGEGQYLCADCGVVFPKLRSNAQLELRDWEMHCPHCHNSVLPMPTNEEKSLFPTSIYAITKRDHEETFLNIGRTYKLPTVALRYFNIYGSRQALSNPYTGVSAIFCSRFINKKPPIVFEDGHQSRDFTHISDIVQANLLALEKDEANYEMFNVGTGMQMSIRQVGSLLRERLAPELELQILGQYRSGDIRHCYADISKIQKQLGYQPRVSFEDGINELIDWVRTQEAEDLVEKAKTQLEERKLVQ